MRWWLARRLYGRPGEVDRSRLLSNWCDYKPAHYGSRFTAMVDGRPWGQSCQRHAALLAAEMCWTGADDVRLRDNLRK